MPHGEKHERSMRCRADSGENRGEREGPMTLQIAVKSCVQHRDAGFHQAIRDTWGASLDVKFFLGGPSAASDEISLDCPDDYHSLPLKTKAICQWAVGQDVEHVFLCDTDTFLLPNKLLSCGFENYDYVGKIDRPLGSRRRYIAVDRDGLMLEYPFAFPWASGGFGYFLSRKAFTIIANSAPYGWAEDLWVGQVLGPRYETGEIKMLHVGAEEYSWHFPSHVFKSGYDLKFGWMYKMFEEHR